MKTTRSLACFVMIFRPLTGLIALVLLAFFWLAWSLSSTPVTRYEHRQDQGTGGQEVRPRGRETYSAVRECPPSATSIPQPIQESGRPIESATATVTTGQSTGYPSLSEALDAARRVIQTVTDSERIRDENHKARFFAHNPQQAMVARFSDGPVRMQSSRADSHWHLEISRGGSSAVVSAVGRQVEYRHSDGVVECYENQSGGFHHSLTVPSRTVGEDDGMLRLRMEVEGLAVAEDSSSPGDLCFTDGEGRAVAAYRGLKAWDAQGRELSATMRPNGAGFELAVNDRDAIYPVRIDPTFYNLEETLLTEMAGTARAGDRFGSATALDGDTAVVTAQLAGRAYVFTRDGSLWSLQAEVLPVDGKSGDEFGNSVDLDGDTLIVGSWKADASGTGDHGSAYVFQRSGQTWSQQAKLTAPTPVSSGQFGYSVSLEGDEVLVGSSQGGAYLFRKTTGVWQFDSQLIGGPSAYGFGISVALDGDTMLIGAPYEAVGVTAQVGAAYVFTRGLGTWNQTLKIASPTAATEEHFGQTVALDGDIAVIGAPHPDYSGAQTDRGAVAIYHRNPENGWDREYYSRLPGSGDMVHHVAVSGESVIMAKGRFGDGSSSLYQRSGT
ncbi:MAG TPA: FG-GAP repeat protein, partial [Luteolibacter sp.]